MINTRATKPRGRWLSIVGFLTALSSFTVACGEGDKFAGETYDEYTTPLTNVVIGTSKEIAPTQAVPIGAELSGKSAGAPIIIGAAAGGASSGGAASSPGGATSSSGVPNVGGKGGGFSEAGSGDGGSSDGGFGFWHFDDCSPNSHFLVDSSGSGANAQQPLKAACTPGISGQGVLFRTAKDLVQVPDEPQFTVAQHVGVAAWVNPTTVTGDQPIVIKRLNNNTAFSLGIHNGNIEMSVVLTTGKTIISRAPIAAKTWTHVAGLYDGTFVFLFINGRQFGQVFAAGTVRDVFAPIRIGATTQSQHFNGIIDEVFLSTQNITGDTLTALACIGRPSTFSVSPTTSGPVPPDTTVQYDVTVSNNDVGACQGKQYELFPETFDPTINFSVNNNFQFLEPGASADLLVDVTGSDDADPGEHILPFEIIAFGNSFEQLSGQLSYVLEAPTGCFVNSRRELMITNLSVVDDPVRTAGSSNPGFFGGGGVGTGGATSIPPGRGGSPGTVSAGGFPGDDAAGAAGETTTLPGSGTSNPGNGVWSFGHLITELAPTPADAPALTLKLLQHWLTDQQVNGFTVAARPAMQQQLIDIWPKAANGELDLTQSPLTLQAIVNRIDIRNLAEGSAGEGRFVFGVNGGSNSRQFNVILEYNLPAQTQADVQNWADSWHALSSHPFPSEEYNVALEALTRRFTDRGAAPSSPNGSALVELRTNEIALSFQWELRSFALSPSTGLLDEVTVKETPDLNLNGSQTFADFVNQNATAIIAEVPGANAHTVPLQFEGQLFNAGSVFNPFGFFGWNAPGILDPNARFHASTNTCNGCHSPETNTGFLMITARSPGDGTEARLSPFITGTTAFDSFSGQVRTLNDLGRRKADLTALVCLASAPAPTPAPAPVLPKSSSAPVTPPKVASAAR